MQTEPHKNNSPFPRNVLKPHDGLSSRPTDAGEKVSGGQKQRIAIARALIRRPKILILDNATSDLDTENEYQVGWFLTFLRILYTCIPNETSSHNCPQQVYQALLNQPNDRTVLLVSSKVSVGEKADHIVVLGNGTVQEEGSHEELMQKGGVYAELVEKQKMGFHRQEEETNDAH